MPGLTIAVALFGCATGHPHDQARGSLSDVRDRGAQSEDAEELGRWALLEMLGPGGSSQGAARAGARLERVVVRSRPGMWATLAKALAVEAHGDPRAAAEFFVAASQASATSADAQAPLVGWFALRHLLSLRGSVTDLFAQHRAAFETLLASPGHFGWRAVTELEDWRALEIYDKSPNTGSEYDAEVVRRMGCAQGIRLAGPFGHGAAADRLRAFPAELPAPWPVVWAPDVVRGSLPRVLPTNQQRCVAVSETQVPAGVFYAETFFATRGDREIIIAVQGAVAVWVDDTPVLTRGVEQWGSWQRFGVHVTVGDGRHRVLARLLTPAASVRLLNPDGSAAGVVADGDVRAPYASASPLILSDPNPLDAVVRAAAEGNSGAASPIEASLSAFLAHAEQLDDVAVTLMEPLTAPRDAGALALQLASTFVAGDPALPEDARGAQSRALRRRALEADPGLWRTRLTTILDDAEQHGLTEGVAPLRRLADEVPGEPEVLEQLARLYGRLGWRAEEMRALGHLAGRFPDDVSALHAYLDVLNEDGPSSEADHVAAHIKRLEPDTEVVIDRALSRQDYKTAALELEHLKKRRPDRKDIALRIADVLGRSGDPTAAGKELAKELAKQPLDVQARFRLADDAYAKGDEGALRRELAAALQAGAPTAELRTAIDLLEGTTDLEPFRKDGRAVIRDFEAWERGGHHMDGTAARVLDYAATWVHGDGSSEMLEHEIQKIQSQEAINAESETQPPSGLVLHLRVIKADGRILEPEPVAGKATLTLPHIEVGDYIEIEHVTPEPGDGAKGREYRSPHWFFREADKGYWRSEFVVVTPRDKDLEIETRGQVPRPETSQLHDFVESRWRVNLSPPAEVEPDSPPLTEFLPSVRVGWGISLDRALSRLLDVVADDTPLDPRLGARARGIVGGVPETSTDERARRVYRWVVEHVQDGKETDGRRVVTGGSGSRQAAFRYLLRLLGINSQLAVVKDRLAAPPLGKMSEVEQYDGLALRVSTEHGPRWMTVRDKFAPYGYVPAELRGQPAVVIAQGMPRDTVHAEGGADAVAYAGNVAVHDDGSADMDLVVTFTGSRAIAWRNALDQVAQAKLHDFVERELIAPSFDGGHVREVTVDGAGALDEPLVLHVRAEAPQLAKKVGAGLSVHAPFASHLGQLGALPARHTPLVRRVSWHTDVRVRVVLPVSAKLSTKLPTGRTTFGDASVVVTDAAAGNAVDYNRAVDLPAGRVEPGDEYRAWQEFVREGDRLLTRDVFVALSVSK